MIRARKFLCLCVAVLAINLARGAADQGFSDLQAYLPPARQTQRAYSPAADAERFRSYARLDKAYRLIQARQLELARQELRPLVEHSPENWPASSAYLFVLYRLADYSQLIKQANLILVHQPHFIPALLYRSKAYIATKQLSEAITGFEILEHLSELRPEDRVSVLESLADLEIRTKDYQRALVTSARVLELQTSYPAWFRKGLALDGLGRAKDAEQAYRSSLALANTPAQRMDALQAIAESLRKAKSWSAARETLLQALEINPSETLVLRSLAETEYQLQNYPEAERHLRRALALQRDVKHRELLANILMLSKDWQEAQAEFSALAAHDNDSTTRARAYRALSEIAEKTGDPARSTEYLKQALAIEPSLSGTEKLANLLIAQGNIVQADSLLTDLAKDLRGASEKHRVLLTLGQLKMTEKQYSTAAEVFTDAVRIRSDASTLAAASIAQEQAGNLAAAIEFSRRVASEAPSAEAHLRLGALLEKFGDSAQALASFETAAKESTIAGEKVAIYNRIGVINIRAKNYEAARQGLEEGLKLDPNDSHGHRSLAEVFMRLERFADASAQFKQAIAIDHDPADRRSLAVAQERAGDFDSAVATYLEILKSLPRPSPAREQVCSLLAKLEAKRGNYTRAADWWLEASKSGGNSQSLLLASAAENLVLAREWRRAAESYERFVTIPDLVPQQRARAFESLGFVSSKLGNGEAAVEFLQRAIDTGAASAAAHENLGFALYALGKWRPALDAFLAVPASEAQPLRLIAIAHCYQKLGKPGLAIHFLDQALQNQQSLTAMDRRQAYADLGFLYADGHDYRAAIDAWRQAQQLTNTSDLALRLARVERLAGNPAEALRELGQIRRDHLPRAEQAEYLDELAQIYARQGKPDDSRRAWEAANQVESSPARNYEIGLAYSRADQVDEAIPFLERAAKPSGNLVYLQSLAYAYKAAGRLSEAVACFKQLDARMPGGLDNYKELAYLEMHLGHNASAERWFRKAIDAERRPEPNEQNAAAFRSRDENLRADLARLENRYNLTLYEGYSDQQVLATSAAIAPGATSITPAGGGIELDYQPPGIGFRNERTLQIFTRAMWSNQSASLVPQSGSQQMGLGARYKPFISQNLQLSFERLIPLSSGIRPNWMARAMSSWSAGFDLRPTERRWNYSLLFVDTAFLLQGPRTAAEFAQFRQGISFRVGQGLLVTPFLIAAARHQSPQAGIGTYLEAGGGLSLRFLFRDSIDLPRKSSFEVLLDCHRGVQMTQPDATSYNSCRAAGVLRF